jgi:hypothetical protein
MPSTRHWSGPRRQQPHQSQNPCIGVVACRDQAISGAFWRGLCWTLPILAPLSSICSMTPMTSWVHASDMARLGIRGLGNRLLAIGVVCQTLHYTALPKCQLNWVFPRSALFSILSVTFSSLSTYSFLLLCNSCCSFLGSPSPLAGLLGLVSQCSIFIPRRLSGRESGCLKWSMGVGVDFGPCFLTSAYDDMGGWTGFGQR